MTDDLLGTSCAHICVDMQEMFARDTEWHAHWMTGVLPAVTALAEAQSARTIFTRFIPPEEPSAARGAWQRYYARWRSMTRDRLPLEMLDLVPPLGRLVPPARIFNKSVYSPWHDGQLHGLLRSGQVDTLVVSGGETDICVLATVLGAIDFGYRVVLPTDAVFGSADQTHDAMLGIYHSRFGQQLTTCLTQDVLDHLRVLA